MVIKTDQMTTPSPEVVEAVSKLDGPVMILGIAGKMGPTLSELLLRAGADEVIGVFAVFQSAGSR